MSKDQPRKPAGVPVGGQFDFKLGSRPDRSLSATQIAGRSEAIKTGRFVQPLCLQAVDPLSWSRPKPWWTLHTWQQEHNHHKGSYPVMPEYGNPVRDARTYRRRYQGSGARVQMPSRAACDRFARTLGDPRTFDLPVDVETPHGSARMSVRITKLAGGGWHVTPLGADTPNAQAGAEAVRSVLEAQRPTTSLLRTGDLLDKARSRHPEGTFNIAPPAVSSTVIEAVGSDKTGAVVVQIRNKLYAYKADPSVAAAIASDPSPGRAYNKFLKGLDRQAMFRCGQCGRLASSKGHTCEAHGKRPGGR